MITLRMAALGCLVLLTSCAGAPQPKYAWGGYDKALYTYYRDPASAAAFAETLEATINSANSARTVVPPGIYAEYGYLLFQQGKSKQAIDAFRMEESHWPESKPFMDHMMQVASTPANGNSRNHP